MIEKPQVAAVVGVLALLLLLSLVFFLFPGPETDESVDYPRYIQKLVSLSGEKNSSCPELRMSRRAPASTSCIKLSIESPKPFWLSIGPVGYHGNAYVGLARNKKGQLWYVIFDKDRTAGYGDRKKPYLAALQCDRIVLTETLTTSPPDCSNWR